MNQDLSALPFESETLDIGCGPHCLPGAIGIDQFEMPGVAVVQDLNQASWRLPSKQFKFIRCQHVIEHIAHLQNFTREIYRVAKPGARIEFVTPHYSSYASWGDPTHLFHFALGSIPQLFDQVLGKPKYNVIKNEIRFTGSAIDVFGWLIYKMSPKKYEKHFAWIFPANEIHTTIEIVKN
jgi:SAM-dependent methyltransferase